MERYLVRRGLARLILLPIVLSVLYAGVVLWQFQRMLGERDWVMHTTEVMTVGMDVQRHYASQEAALRGYLLTRSPYFQLRFATEDSLVDRSFQELHQLVHDNPEQAGRLDSILQRYWTWQASARYSINRDTTRLALLGGLDQRTAQVAIIRETFERFIGREKSLYLEREQRFQRVTVILAITIGLLSILLGIVIGMYARRQANLFIRKFGEAIDESSQSRDLLRTTLMSIGDAIIVTDQFRSITLLNIRAEELTGWTLQEAMGRKIDDVFHIVDEYTMMPIENPVATVLKEQRPIDLRHHSVLLSRKGVEFPIEDSAAPIRNSRRQIVGVVIVFRDITSRRENEREAEQREREFRALIENAPDVIIRYGADLRITYVNPAIEQMLGVVPQALIGRRFKDVGIPDDVYLPWERAVQDVFAKQHPISMEVQYQTLHGLRRYQARLVPEATDSGVQSVISISRDITEIKQTELRLRESEQRFRGFVENSPNAFFLLTGVRDTAGKVIDFRFDYLNERAGDLITLDAGQCLGRRLLEVMPGEASARYVEKYRAMLEAGIPAFEEYQVNSNYLKRASWLRSQYVPIGDSLAITTEDVTDRKTVQEALRLSEKRYRNLVDTAQEAIFSTDETGRFIYCNPYVLDLSGYTADEALKFYFVDLVPVEHKPRVQRHFFRQFLSQTPFSFIEAPFITKDGSLRWLSITTSLRLSDSDVDGFDCIATDVTAHHQREAQLEAAKTRAELSAQESTDRQHHVKQHLVPLLEMLRRASNGDSKNVTTDIIQKLATDLERAIERLG